MADHDDLRPVMSRRRFLTRVGVAAPIVGSLGRSLRAAGDAQPFTLAPLPYPYEALEPYISRALLELHHDKVCAAYVSTLNKLVQEHAPYLASKKIQDILEEGLYTVPEEIRAEVSENAGGIMNHELFFQGMAPKAGGAPVGKLADVITATFGGYEQFTAKFTAAALKRAKSGWAWLVRNDVGKLEVVSTLNQQTPWSNEQIPIVCLDVCEHAYQLQYQDRVEDYIKAWFQLVNWTEAEKRFAAAQEG